LPSTEVDFRLGQDGNNGIALRSERKPDGGTVLGFEVQLIDAQSPLYTRRVPPLRPEQLMGSIYNVIAARAGHFRRGEWNALEILLDGQHIVARMNGITVLDADLDSVRDPALLEQYPGLRRDSGHIGLFGHKSLAEFRNIRIRELP
jgi:hypothetical protein